MNFTGLLFVLRNRLSYRFMMLCSRLSLLRVSLDNGLGVDLSCLCWFSVDFSLLHSLSVDFSLLHSLSVDLT